MLLGGTVCGNWNTPEEWGKLLAASRFKAVTAPFSCRTPAAEIDAYCDVVRRHGAVIAEVGVWKNPFDPDPALAAENVAFAKGQLALADERDVPCCVNIVGTASPAGWDAADPGNFTQETYDRIVASIREIIDEVKPVRAFYCIEPMPWMIPDGPEVYLKLIRDVDRQQYRDLARRHVERGLTQKAPLPVQRADERRVDAVHQEHAHQRLAHGPEPADHGAGGVQPRGGRPGF